MGGLIIAGDRSGTGKTTVTLALLAALMVRTGQARPNSPKLVQSFKVGPDYIDPMFHRAVTGRACYNLDPVLTSETYVQTCYQQHATYYSVVEGVMGLFDGADTERDVASSAHVARLLGLPVVLVVDCGRMSRSVAALVLGYQQLDPQLNFAGVILNRVGSDRHLAFLKSALDSIHVPILGVFRREADIGLPDRHLGLVPVGELTGFKETQHRLAAMAEQGFDWQQLTAIFQQRGPQFGTNTLGSNRPSVARSEDSPEIAVAYDPAFNFYYSDNLTLLEQAGAHLRYWSPMAEPFPNDVQGLYLGGGFPEVFAEALAANIPAQRGVQQAVAHHLPTYAECGGLMYLCKSLVDFNGKPWPMAGVLNTTVSMGKRLSLGYRRATALTASPLLQVGETVTGHEFHRSSLQTPMPSSELNSVEYKTLFKSQRAFGSQDVVLEGTGGYSLQASYLHLHWGTRPDLPQRFVAHCRAWQAHQWNAPF